jgi:hypothetical protein
LFRKDLHNNNNRIFVNAFVMLCLRLLVSFNLHKSHFEKEWDSWSATSGMASEWGISAIGI